MALVGDEAEYHAPDWVFGLHTFDELEDGSLVAVRTAGGRDELVVLRPPVGGCRLPGLVVHGVDQPCVSLSARGHP